MTEFDKIKNMNLEELAEWLDVVCSFSDDSPWMKWFSEKFCDNCPPVQTFVPYLNKEAECSYCELNGNCKFFPDLLDTPENKQIIKMWLESEERA